MEATKLVLIVLLFSMFYTAESSNELDSLKNKRLKYLIGDLNEDCYKDTVYGKIISISKVLPDFIIWGKYDSTIVCDTNRIFYYDSTNVEFTSIKYDSNDVNLLNISTADYTNDYIRDFSFSLKKLDTINGDSIIHFLIIGDNSLSKNQSIFISIDSLANDSLNCISPDISNNSEYLTEYMEHKFYLVDNFNINPAPIVQTKIERNTKEENEYLVYPNPNKGELNISVKIPPFNIEIISLSGQTVYISDYILTSEYSLDISGYTNGIYYVRLLDKNSSRTFKIIKIK